jgi:tetratricopeptide (TPR) repeat protein
MYLIQIGDTHLSNSEYEAAIESYKRAIDVHSLRRKLFWDPFPSIICAYLMMSRTSKEFFDCQIPIDNTFPQHFLWRSLGLAYEALSNSQAARDVYETALDCYKSVLKNDGLLLGNYTFNGLYDTRAFDVFERKDSMPKEALWSVLGELYKMRGDNAKALEAYQEAIVLKPENKWLNEMIDELKTRQSIGIRTHESV